MEELSIVDIFKTLFKRKSLIIGITLAAVVLAFLGTQLLMTPKYQASGTMFVSGKASGTTDTALTINDLTQSQKLVESYAVVLQSRSAAKEILEATGLDYKVDEIQSMISISSINESESMRISVTCTNAADAVTIANAVMDIAPDFLTDIVKVGNVAVIDVAESAVKVSPSLPKNLLIGFAAGFVLSVAFVLLVDMLDQTVKDEDDIVSHYKISVLGVVPNFSMPSKGGYYRYE